MMGGKYISGTGKTRSGKYEDAQVPPGMTTIVCQRCGRKLGRVFSTNGIMTCDKCGYRFYTRIYGETVITMPVRYLEYEGYYDDADEYIHKVQKRVKAEQILIREPVFEME